MPIGNSPLYFFLRATLWSTNLIQYVCHGVVVIGRFQRGWQSSSDSLGRRKCLFDAQSWFHTLQRLPYYTQPKSWSHFVNWNSGESVVPELAHSYSSILWRKKKAIVVDTCCLHLLGELIVPSGLPLFFFRVLPLLPTMNFDPAISVWCLTRKKTFGYAQK